MSATGRKRRGLPPEEKAKNEAYQTPRYVVDLLLAELVKPRGPIVFLEPCRGECSIYGAVREWLPGATMTHAEIAEGIDYLDGTERRADLCITNPPFSLAVPFIDRSLEDCGSVFYLLALNFFGSQRRAPWWRQEHMTPSHLMSISKRPKFRKGSSDACDYAWFCWDRLGMVKPGPPIRVLA